ncbi:MAG: aminotransferase class I/II-fold pyridoxal phosphate-dependent enzyme [Desulfamplus sp.]|nr:aminotransferase class I/II-fold pyridoxal phosphate-dependent enzyme [Desulfamplus sp.]MBF0258903.1 aminotransferase class I/II-fold pyridoxal phosphate-dependent enzyme [Desulfamplus sp.]
MAKTPHYSKEETKIVHGITTCHTTSMDLVPPIHMTSTFKFKDQAQGAAIFAGTEEGYLYTRISNPTVDLLEEKIALLEGAGDAVATSSGMAAVAATVMSLVRPGENIVACNALYGGTFALFHTHLKRLDIEVRFISPAMSNDRNNIIPLVDDKTRLLYIETPANPTLDIIDIDLWATIAGQYDLPLAVDNTFASPYLQKPLSLGADIVIHSATKYLGGHGDIIGGIIASTPAMIARINEEYFHHFGPAMSPFNAWLILRGLKTLAIRMERHSKSALTVAKWLDAHPKIAKVYYPGLPAHHGHDVALRQMKYFSGVMAFEVKGGMDAGKKVLNGVQLCILAVSLGDCETLIQHPASMTHATYSKEDLKKAGIAEGLIRLSVGLEHPDDIIDDLDQALSSV